MKKFKKLIPAFCAMLVSAAMLGTSTYAWFSVNKKVEANGMSVTAQANTQYFAITNTAPTSGSFVAPASNINTATAGTASQPGAGTGGKVIPVAKASATHTLNTVTVNSGEWYTANVSVYDDNSSDKATLTKLTYNANKSDLFTQTTYFVGYTFYVGLTSTSSDYAGQLSFKAKKLADGHVEGIEIAGVKVEGKKQTTAGTNFEASNIVDANAEILEIFTATDAVQSTQDFVLKADGTAYVTVTVYLCINGENNNVIDSRIESLTGNIGIEIEGE